jgi:phage shock protein PspC (stress-responsive transcriptional regulator)
MALGHTERVPRAAHIRRPMAWAAFGTKIVRKTPRRSPPLTRAALGTGKEPRSLRRSGSSPRDNSQLAGAAPCTTIEAELVLDPKEHEMDTRDTDPIEPQPGETPPEGGGGPQGGPPKRLYRSRTDRVLGGVCGGLGRYFGIDPVIIRLLAIVLTLAGGAGVVAYLVALLLVPQGEGEAAAGDTPPRRGPGTLVAAILLLIVGIPLVLTISWVLLPFVVLALVGLLISWIVSGEGPSGEPGDLVRRAAVGVGLLIVLVAVALGSGWLAGVGGGVAMAALLIAVGLLLVVGAFFGGVRWVILPALAIALPLALVSAAGIDLHGGVGDRRYKPASSAQLHDRYRLGVGRMVVDLRDAKLPAGERKLKLDVGIGEAVLLLPNDVCAATNAHAGAGQVQVFDRESGGVDVDWSDTPRARDRKPRLVVDADVGLGRFAVGHSDAHLNRGFHDDVDAGRGNTACVSRAA